MPSSRPAAALSPHPAAALSPRTRVRRAWAVRKRGRTIQSVQATNICLESSCKATCKALPHSASFRVLGNRGVPLPPPAWLPGSPQRGVGRSPGDEWPFPCFTAQTLRRGVEQLHNRILIVSAPLLETRTDTDSTHLHCAQNTDIFYQKCQRS